MEGVNVTAEKTANYILFSIHNTQEGNSYDDEIIIFYHLKKLK